MQSGVKNGTVTVAGTIEGALDSLGNFFPLGSAAVVPGYDTSGNMITETATYNGGVWIRTHTYTNGVYGGVSQWVKQ